MFLMVKKQELTCLFDHNKYQQTRCIHFNQEDFSLNTHRMGTHRGHYIYFLFCLLKLPRVIMQYQLICPFLFAISGCIIIIKMYVNWTSSTRFSIEKLSQIILSFIRCKNKIHFFHYWQLLTRLGLKIKIALTIPQYCLCIP